MRFLKKAVYKLLLSNRYELVSKDNYKGNIHELVNAHKRSEEYIKELVHVYEKCVFLSEPNTLDKTTISLISNLLGTDIVESIYILHYLKKCLNLDGDICEFGVAQGRTSILMANCILNTEKKLWLYDSFEGLPKPSEKDKLKDDIFGLGSMDAYEGTMSCSVDQVLYQMASNNIPEDKYEVVKGFIEDTINTRSPQKVSFAYVDFDFYQPIKTALEYLDKALVHEGVIIVDDYDFFSEGAKKAVDEFMVEAKDRYKISFPISLSSHFCVVEKVL